MIQNRKNKYLLIFIIGIIIFSSIIVGAEYLLSASDVAVSSSKTSKKNLADVIDELYTKAEELEGDTVTSLEFITNPGNKYSEGNYIVEDTLQLEINSTFNLDFQIQPSSAKKDFVYYSYDESIAKVSKDGLITGIGRGITTILVIPKSNPDIKKKLIVSVVSKSVYIKMNNGLAKNNTGPNNNIEFEPYKREFVTNYNENTSYGVQTFAIKNVEKSNETFFFSGARAGSYTGTTLTDDQKANLQTTMVMRVPSANLKRTAPATGAHQYVYWKNTGHGQGLYVEQSGTDDYLWLNANSKLVPTYGSDGNISGYSSEGTAIMRIKYTGTSYIAGQNTLQLTTPNPVAVYNPVNENGVVIEAYQSAVDEDNNMIAIIYTDESDTNNKKNFVYIYDLECFKRKEYKIINHFEVLFHAGYPVQGMTIAKGYVYILYSQVSSKIEVINKLAINAYNIAGAHTGSVRGYTMKYNNEPILLQEAEGIQVYNDKIYIGIMHNYDPTDENYVKYHLFSIYRTK